MPIPPPFRGSYTALVTPFRDGALDEKAFRGLVDWQIAETSTRRWWSGASSRRPAACR